MHICIIDMQFYHNNICDYQKVFDRIDKNITLTIMKYNQKNIIEQIKHIKSSAIIVSGSRYRILHKNASGLPEGILNLNIPVLGICYGFEWQMKVLHGKIGTHADGFHKYNKMIKINAPFSVPKKLYFFAHNDYILDIPNNWKITHKNNNQVWCAYDPILKHVGVQFHPEKHISSATAFFSAWLKWINS